MGKYLDSAGVSELWSQVKAQDAAQIKANVTDKLGAANGIATLGSDSKLTATQLPTLKTVNGQSIVGSGDIAIDLGIYQVVSALPESNQNPNKIYLVLTSPATEQEQDVYTEYLWVDNKWEKLGEYKAAVDLTPYVAKSELDKLVGEAGYIKESAIDSKVSGLGYAKESFVTGQGYQNAAQVNALIAAAVTGGTLDLKDYVKFTDVASAEKAGVIKTGYTDNAKNYKVQVDGTGNAFVAVNWEDTKYSPVSGTENGLMTVAQSNKLSAIADEATKDEALTVEEVKALLV